MNWLTCWDLDLWGSNGGSPCITKLTTFFFLKTNEITGTPHVPHSFRCDNLIQQSPLIDCDMWLWDQWIMLGLSLCCPSSLSALTSSTLFSTTPKESQLHLTVSDSLLTKAAMLFFLIAATWEPIEDLSRYCKTSSMAKNQRFSAKLNWSTLETPGLLQRHKGLDNQKFKK